MTIAILNTPDLRVQVRKAMDEHGPACDLNHLDVGTIQSFEGIFKGTGFCGDVSGWDMRNAAFTTEMFMDTPFNGDVSRWRMPRLEDTKRMFANCPFNGDVSGWGCASLLRRYQYDGMFNGETFAQDLSAWAIAEVREAFQIMSLKTLTRSSVLWAAISDKKPPTAPDAATLRASTVQAYAKLFGGDEGLARYLARTPFGAMHFDACTAADNCPDGVQEDDYRWCQELLSVGIGLGLDNTQLRELFAAQRNRRDQTHDALELPSGMVQ